VTTKSRYPVAIAILVTCALCVACSSRLEDAGAKYREQRDYASLEIVVGNLSQGMDRKRVETLLGEADYSPTKGLYYYSSSKREHDPAQGRDVSVGLVVDYRDKDGKVTEALQQFAIQKIGE
jgi:hypothetical protein